MEELSPIRIDTPIGTDLVVVRYLPASMEMFRARLAAVSQLAGCIRVSLEGSEEVWNTYKHRIFVLPVAQDLRLFRIRSPGPTAFIVAPTSESAIELFCAELGNGEDEDRSELAATEIASDEVLNISDADNGKPDERTAAQWIASCNGRPTIVGHSEV